MTLELKGPGEVEVKKNFEACVSTAPPLPADIVKQEKERRAKAHARDGAIPTVKH